MDAKQIMISIKNNHRRIKAASVVLIFQFFISCYLPGGFGGVGCGSEDSGVSVKYEDPTIGGEKICYPPELNIVNDTIYNFPQL